MKLTSDFVSHALGLRIARSNSIPFSRVVTDSRKVAKGDLFVAIKGESFDGNQFVANALSAGATGVICEKGRAPRNVSNQSEIFEVDDTLKAFRELAREWRMQFSIPVICVAGSVGKTTTKELLAALLSGRWKGHVLKTQGSQNGFVGIPMTLLELNAETKAAVIEVGIDEIGAMIQHLEVVQPTHSIVTAIGPEHLEKLKDLKTVAEEECLALTQVDQWGGFTAINLDESEIAARADRLNQERAIFYSLTEQVSREYPHFLTADFKSAHSEIEIKTGLYKGSSWRLPLAGVHNARNFLGALAVSEQLRLTKEQISEGLSNFTPPWGRSETRTTPSGVTVVCDFYNANPSSMRAAFSVVSEMPKKNLFLCLGDMLELGDDELKFHEDLATDILALKPKCVYLTGPRMKSLSNQLKQHKQNIVYDLNLEGIAADLKANIHPGDVILIKGSRGMKLENLWELIASNN